MYIAIDTRKSTPAKRRVLCIAASKEEAETQGALNAIGKPKQDSISVYILSEYLATQYLAGYQPRRWYIKDGILHSPMETLARAIGIMTKNL